jgi:hypothetical protein
MSQFKKEFSVLWDTEVKKQIQKCTPEYETLRKMDNVSEADAKILYEEIQAKGYHDVYGQYVIGNLIWVVEHALADDRLDLNFISTFSQIRGTLNDDEYWGNVFGVEIECDEAKELMKLRDYINLLGDMIEL